MLLKRTSVSDSTPSVLKQTFKSFMTFSFQVSLEGSVTQNHVTGCSILLHGNQGCREINAALLCNIKNYTERSVDIFISKTSYRHLYPETTPNAIQCPQYVVL